MRTYLAKLRLSEREEQTITLAADGLTDKEIAREMGVSLASVRTYWARLRHKLGTTNRSQSLGRVFQLAFDPARHDSAGAGHAIGHFFESDQIGVALQSLDGRTLWANDAYLRIVGYTREEVEAGKLRWDSITAPEFRERDRESVIEMRTYGMATPYEKEYLKADGTRVRVRRSGLMVDRDTGLTYIVELADAPADGESSPSGGMLLLR